MKFPKKPSITNWIEMFINQTDEIKVTNDRKAGSASQQAVRPAKMPSGKKCIYMSNQECTLPASTPFSLCKSCPYGYMYCFGAVVKNVYTKIIGIASFLINTGMALPDIFNKDKEK